MTEYDELGQRVSQHKVLAKKWKKKAGELTRQERNLPDRLDEQQKQTDVEEVFCFWLWATSCLPKTLCAIQ